jgi:PAS domain S-box-containing protein
MKGDATLYAPILGLGTLLPLALAVYGWRRRGLVPGFGAFAVFNVGVAVWTGLYVLELAASEPAQLFWANATYLGIGLVPASWLVFALQFSGLGGRVTRRVVALLSIEPATTLLLAWTNPWHLLFRRTVSVAPTWEPGPAFWVHAAYSYALVLGATVLMARQTLLQSAPRRNQARVLVVAALVPWGANAFYLSGASPFGNLDLTPFAFWLTSLLAAWVLFHELEQRVISAERRFRALVDHTVDAIEIIDPETGRVLDVNASACAALGYTREEYLARTMAEIDPNVAARSWREALDEVRRAGSRVFESEHRRKDGSRFPVEVSAAYISLERDYVLAVARDITERKRSEARLGELLAEAKQLEEQFRQAQKMEAVGRLAGGVAHDFNNILGIVIGSGEALLKQIDADSPLRPKLEQIQKAAARAASLTRQLLAFSRQQVLQPRPVDLNEVVSEIEDMLRTLIGKDVLLTTKRGQGLGSVEADPGQLQQVVMNLAVNARDAMPEGGELTIETANLDVGEANAAEFPMLQPGRYVMLAISDTGVGMNEATRARLFEPFFTTKELGRGTGLGLSTVYGIVQQSGGTISVESELGSGSCFRVFLPRVAPAARPAPEPQHPTAAGGPETVLLVEDEADLRDLIHETLADEGYRVLVARDGSEAVRLAADHEGPIHLMVTDVIMPRVTGRKAAEEIRKTRPAMEVLYVSGYTDDAILRHGVPGTAAFLEKPFALGSLLRKVRELLGRG